MLAGEGGRRPRAPIPTWYFALVVVRLGHRFLVVREAKHGQHWYMPAGRVEPGETMAETAVRETMEEAGIPSSSRVSCAWSILPLPRTPVAASSSLPAPPTTRRQSGRRTPNRSAPPGSRSRNWTASRCGAVRCAASFVRWRQAGRSTRSLLTREDAPFWLGETSWPRRRTSVGAGGAAHAAATSGADDPAADLPRHHHGTGAAWRCHLGRC
ncbi:MAG: NUDIX hydrolase [Dehalococcoidia bacterium]